MLLTRLVQCPYCWEMIDVLVDASCGTQQYTEDCSVCCHPIVLHVIFDEWDELVDVKAEREFD